MDECPSPVKCAPPPMKRGRMPINWQRCIICQNITQETRSMTTDRENMTNPFHVDNHLRQLINISTGLHASHNIEDSLLKSVETGRTKMKICVESSLSTDKAERHRRSATTATQKVYHITEGRTVPDWTKFLSSNKNNQALITFLEDYLSSNLSDMFQEENNC
ncbi:Hypothetical predicted protein [Mytilus galloprovincialis]|uniref:Uncharacterized protein n=1 Tax=Mytilus galloprovincialis TaxID=29158 RepID=A0A8B6FHL0_MYTGA|nr:Hypothetical predicted protein [Mytilus galloprovincialis]